MRTVILLTVLSLTAGGMVSAAEPLVVRPSRVELHSPEDSVQVLAETVTGGRTVDRTRDARWAVDDNKIARVDPAGLVTPLSLIHI